MQEKHEWHNSISKLALGVTDPMYPWLTAQHALSNALRKLCKELRVQVIYQCLTSATAEEQNTLNIAEDNSLVREVYLLGDGVPLVHARVVVPFNTYQQYKTEFDALGNKLLGEHFLYLRSHVRGPFQYAKWNINDAVLYARRSIFMLNEHNAQILIVEQFLATITQQHLK